MVQQLGTQRSLSMGPGKGDRFLSAGEYLGWRLLELGVRQMYCVPGDFNLPLLDSLARVPGLLIVNCASELGCAYAADGQARAAGLGCCVTTFLVGALSAINGVAASYAEELPVLSIVGVPSTKEYAAPLQTLHHTLGNAEDMTQEVDCYKPVTCYQTILRSYVDARYLIDKALSKALLHRKPVLMEVCRDIPMVPHPSFGCAPPAMSPFTRPRLSGGPEALTTAAAAVAEFLNTRKMPLILAGRRARLCQPELEALASACGYPVAVLVDGKGFFNEHHPGFVGTYFKALTDPMSLRELVDASDALLCVGVHFNELAWGPPPDGAMESRAVLLYKSRAVVGHRTAFTGVDTAELLVTLAGLLKHNPSGLDFMRSRPRLHPTFPYDPNFVVPEGVPLKLATFYDFLQHRLLDNRAFLPSAGSSSSLLSSSSSGGGSSTDLAGAGGASDGPLGDARVTYDLLVDTSDSLLRSHRFKLPVGGAQEVQVFAGNIGWAPAAGLGYSLASQASGKRLVVVCGDGGFQMTASELGNYAKFGSNAIMILVNNDGYLIERYVSPIPHSNYNYTKRWNHTLLAEAMCNGEGKYKILKVTNEEEAQQALDTAAALQDHFVFIEVVIDKRDAAPGAVAFRQGFMAAHFAHIPGYEHLQQELGSAFAAVAGAAAAGDDGDNPEHPTETSAAAQVVAAGPTSPEQLKRRTSGCRVSMDELRRMSSSGIRGLVGVDATPVETSHAAGGALVSPK